MYLFIIYYTWDYVTVERDCITLIEHKKFASVETIRKLLQILMNAALQLEHFLADILYNHTSVSNKAWKRMQMFVG